MSVIYRKKIFNQVQHFIHLNLCVALLLGLIAFVGGIEQANEYRVRILYIIIAYISCILFYALGELS